MSITYYDRYLDTYWNQVSRGSGGYQGFHSLEGRQVRIHGKKGEKIPPTWRLLDENEDDPFDECPKCGRPYE